MNRLRQSHRGVLAVMLMLLSCCAAAVIEIAPLSNAELEARYRELIDELRCPKCQNQNLADSNSPIAADLREQIRMMLEEGKNDEEIVTYLVDRYGEFVRYRPALNASTAMLWLVPGALLVIGLVVIVIVVRTNRRGVETTGELSLTEKLRLEELMNTASLESRKSDVSGDHHS